MMRMQSVWQAMWLDVRAVAAVEFAVIAPFLVFMAAGSAELVHYVRTRDMFYCAVSSLTDVIASETGVRTTTAQSGTSEPITDACQGARLTLVDDPLGQFAAAVISVTNYSSTGVTFDWENDTGCVTAHAAVGATAAVSAASALVPNVNDSVIMVQASVNYIPYLSGILPAYTFQATLFSRPRYGQVFCTGC